MKILGTNERGEKRITWFPKAWQGSEQQHWWRINMAALLPWLRVIYDANGTHTKTKSIAAAFPSRICRSCFPQCFSTPPEIIFSGMLAWMSHHLIPITKTKIKFISSTRCFCDLHNHTHAQNLEYVKNSCVLINCYIYHLPSHSKEISWVSLSRFCYNPYLMTWSVP